MSDMSAMVAFLVVVAGALYLLRALVVPLLLALTLAMLVAPIVGWLEQRRVPRALGGAMALGGLLLCGLLLLTLVVPRLVVEVSALIKAIPSAISKIEELVGATFGIELPRSFSSLVALITEKLQGEYLEKAISVLTSGGKAMSARAGDVVSGVGSAFGIAVQFLLIPVLAYFIVVELTGVQWLLERVLPAFVRKPARRYGPPIARALQSLVKGQVIVAGVMTVIYVIGLSIVGVPLALAIGLLAGLAYLIPFASGAVCVGLSALFVVMDPDAGWFALIGAVVTAVVVQLVEGWVLTPRIVGEQAGLSPLAVVLSVLVFGEVFGFLGLVFALPVAAAFAVVVREDT